MNDVLTPGGSCAICGGSLGRVLLEITKPDRFERHIGIAEEGYRRQWVECARCGGVSDVYQEASRTKLESLATSYYEVDFAGSDIGAKFRKVMDLPADRSDNAGRVDRVRRYVRRWLDMLPEAGSRTVRVLDVGAGTGVFLACLLAETREDPLTWSACAIEPDPNAAEHLRSLGIFEVVEALFWGQEELRDYDLVTMNKVLEHIADPIGTLRYLRAAMRRDRGLAYIEVPDKLTISHRPPEDNILGALHHHLYHPRSLSLALEAAGLIPLTVERMFEPSGKITVYAFASTPEAVATLAEENA